MKSTYFLAVVLVLILGVMAVYFFRPRPSEDFDTTIVMPADTDEPIDNTEPWPPKPEGLDFFPVSELRRVTLVTNKGDIDILLDGTRAPLTVGNFLFLAENDFYDGTSFHRVIPDFMIQGGDPLSKDQDDRAAHGTGGPNYSFQDEINATSYGLDQQKLVDLVPPDQLEQLSAEAQLLSLMQYYELQGYRYTTQVESLPLQQGVVAMANSGPNTNGSQFFIITADSVKQLEGKHTPFGVVEKGLELVLEISGVATDDKDNPIEPVIIEDVIVHEAGLRPGLESAQ